MTPNHLSEDFSTDTSIFPSATRSPTMVGSRNSAFSGLPPRSLKNSGNLFSSCAKISGVKPHMFMDAMLSAGIFTPSAATSSPSHPILDVSTIPVSLPFSAWQSPLVTVPFSLKVLPRTKPTMQACIISGVDFMVLRNSLILINPSCP